ncbi:uncharacterized protein E0L32_002254 [Thyridium curvatum]|uniref:Phospholipid metabolism enzyme regulator n=1 Tax=Thyridium curvatum TaxID=1093900 RepID=A0A507APJ8_9PEZI|nr:uncharacterized protein E0L32_002254 [Thyridium curvatum]TPX06758.1 hypothetical protein E0L32_002254 [Thyridium curvatum]
MDKSSNSAASSTTAAAADTETPDPGARQPSSSASSNNNEARHSNPNPDLHPTPARRPRDSPPNALPRTDSYLARQIAQASGIISGSNSARSTPLASRESSPSRPSLRSAAAAARNPQGTRSRKNSADTSPSRPSRSTAPSPGPHKSLSSTAIPTLNPASSDASARVAVPQKNTTLSADQSRDAAAPRWPVSPRLRSPPPILNKPQLAPPARKADQEPPTINVQRATPSPQPIMDLSQTDTDSDEVFLQSGARTPARSNSTLETVQEASPLGSPQALDAAFSKLESSFTSDAGSQPDSSDVPSSTKTIKPKVNLERNDSGSESVSSKMDRRSGASGAPPPLTTRQSSASIKPSKGKPGEASLQTMTVETETVTSIPQVALAPSGAAASNGSIRNKPSSETIRPKKDKKKPSRKQPSVPSGTGEPSSLQLQFQPKLRHHQSLRSVSSRTDACLSPTKPCGQGLHADEPLSPQRHSAPGARNQSLSLQPKTSLLTLRSRTASSKADIFEAKVASAVDEANTSDSEETFVYDSNPPDGRDRPQRFHSRTPSTTSMASQVDRNGMRSIHSVMEGSVTSAPAVKKNMKFVNTNTLNTSGNDSAMGDEEGKGTGRSTAGSNRGTARHHHHIGRWGRNGHTSLFDNESPFPGVNSARSKMGSMINSRQSSGPPSPRFNSGRNATGKRHNMSLGYDLGDTTGADDETTPLIPSSMRSARSTRSRRHPMTLRALEHQAYRRHQPSFLNRFASCLVLTVMLLLVVSGAIGFMFATSQPLTDIELVKISNVIASEQELMFDMMVKAHNPNVVVVNVDAADLEVFAKSPHAGTDSEWWRRPQHGGDDRGHYNNGGEEEEVHISSAAVEPPSDDEEDKAPNMRLGTITAFDSPLSFEGSFFHQGISASTGGVRLRRPGNQTDGGSERWERIMKDEFDLIVKGVLKYSLPLSQRVRSVPIDGRTKVKPNAASNPKLPENGTVVPDLS